MAWQISPMSKDDQNFWDIYNGVKKTKWWDRLKAWLGGYTS